MYLCCYPIAHFNTSQNFYIQQIFVSYAFHCRDIFFSFGFYCVEMCLYIYMFVVCVMTIPIRGWMDCARVAKQYLFVFDVDFNVSSQFNFELCEWVWVSVSVWWLRRFVQRYPWWMKHPSVKNNICDREWKEIRKKIVTICELVVNIIEEID